MATVPVYCVCGKPYDPTKFMIQCDACKEWFHGGCVGLYEHQSTDIEKYHCPKCEKMFGPSISKHRTNWHRHNYSEVDAEKKAVQTGTPVFVKELKSRHFPSAEEILLVMRGQQLTLPYLLQNGFDRPISVESVDGLGLVVPPSTFTLEDAQFYLGPEMELDAIDVSKQEDIHMTLNEFVRYFNSSVRSRVINVISLEFSNTKLASLVDPPHIVSKLSWVNNIWPDQLPDDCSYTRPLVQKYCLVGVRDSYTDFHIDFGGSSVWYHVLRGEKVFYLIRPTQANLALYKRWMASSNRSETFFGDQVDACYRFTVRAGHTLFIPTGWIHAVLTPIDSIVFGGNFLHSLNLPLQLQIYDIEKRIKTPDKFRFPSFETCNWYAAKHVLEEMKEQNASEGKPLTYLVQGAKALCSALKNWTQDKDHLKAHKEEIPADISYSKLIKDLAKEVRHAEKAPQGKRQKVRHLPPRDRRGRGMIKMGAVKTSPLPPHQPIEQPTIEQKPLASHHHHHHHHHHHPPADVSRHHVATTPVSEPPSQPLVFAQRSPVKIHSPVKATHTSKQHRVKVEPKPPPTPPFVNNARPEFHGKIKMHLPIPAVKHEDNFKVPHRDAPAASQQQQLQQHRRAKLDDSIYDFHDSDEDDNNLVVDEAPSSRKNGSRKGINDYGRRQGSLKLKLSINGKLSAGRGGASASRRQTKPELVTDSGAVDEAGPLSPKLGGIEELLRASGYATDEKVGVEKVGAFHPLTLTKEEAPDEFDEPEEDENDQPEAELDAMAEEEEDDDQILQEASALVAQQAAADCEDPFVVSSSGRASPSTREAIQGMLSIGLSVQFNPDPSSVASPLLGCLPPAPMATAAPLGTCYAPTAATMLTLSSATSSLANEHHHQHNHHQLHQEFLSSPVKSVETRPAAKRKRKAKSFTPDRLEQELLESCHQDSEFVYPSLDSIEEDGPVFKGRGRTNPDESWNPKARLVPNCPKPERPVREGVRKEAVENGLAAAAARLAHLPPPKRPYYRKKPVKPKKGSPATKEAEPKPGPSTSDDPNLFDPSAPLSLTLKGAGGPFKGKKAKKGFATAKQRLGRILKIHRMLH